MRYTLLLRVLLAAFLCFISHVAGAWGPSRDGRCLYAQLPKGYDQKLYLVMVQCRDVMPVSIPREVWDRVEAGVPTILLKCYNNDCYLTRDIVRKYAETNDVLPPWNGQER